MTLQCLTVSGPRNPPEHLLTETEGIEGHTPIIHRPCNPLPIAIIAVPLRPLLRVNPPSPPPTHHPQGRSGF